MREHILEETLVLFNQSGFDFKMDELAKALHISKKTIYKYFSTKEDIFRVLIIESFQSVHDRQLEIFNNPSLTIKEKLLQILNSRSKYEDQLSVEKTLSLKDYYPKLYDLILETYQTQWDHVDYLLTQGKKENIFRDDIDNEVVKTMLMEGMQMMHRDNVLQKSGLSYRQAIAQVVDIIINGISK